MDNIPSHIGIIMDGNGRWAKKQGKIRTYGHKFGSENVEKIATHAFGRGVKTLTLYAFSSENWARPKEEVDELMRLLEVYIKKFAKKLFKNKIKLSVMGDITALSTKLQKSIRQTIDAGDNESIYTLNIAINYGARQEIVKAVKDLIAENEEITEQSILSKLYTAQFGEPDLIIRTGGEYRLSNFMLYQGAYSELYFTDVLWPDFDEKQFDIAIEDYSHRNRRFGKV